MKSLLALSFALTAAVLQAATVEISVPKKAFVKDLSALGCAPGFGYNDALHTLSTGRADVFYSERTNETAAAFRGAGVRVLRAPSVLDWQGEAASRAGVAEGLGEGGILPRTLRARRLCGRLRLEGRTSVLGVGQVPPRRGKAGPPVL